MAQIGLDRAHGGAAGTRLDFSASISPLGPPAGALAAYRRAAATLGAYPEPYADSLRQALAAELGTSADRIVAANGSTQLFYLLARVLRPRRAHVVIPTFSEIANSLLVERLAPRGLRLAAENGFRLEPRMVDAALRAGADALFFGRPNSPTASMLDLDAAGEIIAACERRECWCVLDEAFIDFADQPRSATELLARKRHLVVVRSMTKLYAIPGLRLGYVAAPRAVARALAAALEPWSVSAPALAVGLACLQGGAGWRERVRATLKRERDYLMRGLGALAGFRVFPSAANFMMLKVDERSGPRLGEFMAGRGLALRDLRGLPGLPGAGRGYYRLGVRRRADNRRLLAAARAYSQIKESFNH